MFLNGSFETYTRYFGVDGEKQKKRSNIQNSDDINL